MACAVSANSGVAQADGHKFEFTVRNYNELPIKQPVLSNTFICDGDTWQMSVTCGIMRVVVVHVKLLAKCATNNSTRMARIHCCNVRYNHTKIAVINKNGDQNLEFGDPNCVTFDSPYEKDLKLEVTILKSLEASEVKPKPKIMDDPPKSKMAAEVLKWFQTGDFGDTTIMANDGKKFRCHRDILAARSEVFKLMFNTPMKESKENLVEIDYDGNIVVSLLQFVYIDDVGEIGPFADRLYVAAHHYQLNRLKILCESAMAASLSADSFLQIYRLATFYHLDKLLAVCVDYLDTHKNEMSMADLLAASLKFQ